MKNYDYCNQALALKDEVEGWYIKLGELLMKIRDQELYKPSWESFEEFVMELKWSYGTCSKLINIYRKFIYEYGFTHERLSKAGGWSVLAEALPLIKSKSDAERFLGLAETLTKQHFRQQILEERTGVKMDECEHENTYKLEICKKCGLKWEIK